jgi:hypothetical protein
VSILDPFCAVDDVWQAFAPRWEQELLPAGRRRRRREIAVRRAPRAWPEQPARGSGRTSIGLNVVRGRKMERRR